MCEFLIHYSLHRSLYRGLILIYINIISLTLFLELIRHMLMIVDNEEFYEQEKPLSLKDNRYLIVILREVQFSDGFFFFKITSGRRC